MIPVLYQDNHLLVVNKPAGMLVQQDETGDPDLLTVAKAYVKEMYRKPGKVYLGLVHRLDRPVSGVMVFARTSKAAARLSTQFRERTVEKRYLALVEGKREGSGRCIDYLVKEERRVRVVPPTYAGARRAELAWDALASQDGRSLVEVVLETGRPHQIRIQLAHSGFPIVGDFRYGATQELDGRNIALHCYRLALEHPTQKQRMGWQAPPPESWRGTFGEQIERLLTTQPDVHPG
ncbi:MAG TPA: RNA pseudouridine synthase [Rhodothermales bacterium]|nr:RNA pseudouridine synthase [Rhodothermales bacterium]